MTTTVLLRVHALQGFERVVERDQVQRTLAGGLHDVVKGELHGPGATLGGMAVARVIDQNSPDQWRSYAEEVGTVLRHHALLVDEAHPRFVDQGRRCSVWSARSRRK